MTTYVLNCKTARLFALVKNARASGQSKGGKVKKGEWYWAYEGVRLPRFARKCQACPLGLCITDYEGKTDCFAAYIRSSASQSKERKKYTIKPCITTNSKSLNVSLNVSLSHPKLLYVFERNDCDKKWLFLLPCKWNLLSQKGFNFALSLAWKVRVYLSITHILSWLKTLITKR